MNGMDVSISCLPEETQAYILTKLDGRTAAVAKNVCKLWNELITGFETCMHFWLRSCLREISPYTLVELSRLMELSGGRGTTVVQQIADWRTALHSNLHWMYWKQVYAEYWRYRYITNGIEKKIELHFNPSHGQVRCLYVQDNVVYSGHESGEVISWRNFEDNLELKVLYKHHRRVTDITGLDMVMATKNILNGECVNKIVSSSMDNRLILYNLTTKTTNTIQHYSKQVNHVRSWGNHFVAAADRSLLQGQPIWRSSDRSNAEADILCTIFSQSVADITAVAFWEDTVISGDSFGNLYIWSDCLGCAQNSKQDMTYVTSLGSSIKSIYLLGKRIICYTSDGCLNVSKDKGDDFSKHNIYEYLYRTPECIVYQNTILAIGCRFGAVYLYHIPTDKDWDCLDIATPTRVIQTSHEHIHSLVIGDDGDGPFVTIATEGYSILIVQYKRHNLTLHSMTSHVREW